MLKVLVTLALIIFLTTGVYASCNETQIDINTANSTELDKIKWIGPSTAENIINYRQNNQFDTVDELLNVSGIGLTKLSDIKSQGLACVDEETITENENNEAIINETIEETSENSTIETENTSLNESGSAKSSTAKPATNTITLNVIDLNSKDIKSESNKETLKKNLALGGIATFCIGFGALFFLRFARRKTKNEFR